jgi:hypothetical protein
LPGNNVVSVAANNGAAWCLVAVSKRAGTDTSALTLCEWNPASDRWWQRRTFPVPAWAVDADDGPVPARGRPDVIVAGDRWVCVSPGGTVLARRFGQGDQDGAVRSDPLLFLWDRSAKRWHDAVAPDDVFPETWPASGYAYGLSATGVRLPVFPLAAAHLSTAFVVADDQARLWLGTNRGLLRYAPHGRPAWRRFLPDRAVTAGAPGPDNALYVLNRRQTGTERPAAMAARDGWRLTRLRAGTERPTPTWPCLARWVNGPSP